MPLLKVPYLHLDAIDVRIIMHIQDHGPIDHDCLLNRFPGLADTQRRLERLIGAGIIRRDADRWLQTYRAATGPATPPRSRPWAPTVPPGLYDP